jgi:nucleoside-diphosphate-sugar epimerase
VVLVTGAAGQVGTTLVRHLRSTGHDVLPSDIRTSLFTEPVHCDLRSDRDVIQLFEKHRFSAIVHLAAVLPTAFRSDPLIGGAVNLSGTLRLLKATVDSSVRRFVFGSSVSVYGNSPRPPCSETADPSPDESYGASKLAIEKILEQVTAAHSMETVSLRIARVLGPGAKNTGSPWRSQIFERPSPSSDRLTISFAPEAKLSVIHVEDLARALRMLIEVPNLPRPIYNAPAELVRADEIKRLAERVNGWQMSLGNLHGGPEIDSTGFIKDFQFVALPVKQYLTTPPS